MARLDSRKMATICAVLILTLAPVGILVHNYNTLPSGYVAPYVVLDMWLLTLLVTIIAAILVAIPRTRFAGFVFAAVIFLIPFSFYCGVKLSMAAGLNHWIHAPKVRIGPDVVYSVVVYYKLGATRTQMDQLESAQLYQPRNDNRGKDFKPGIRGFLGLAPNQAYGHTGFALNFDPSMERERREFLISSLLESPVVFKVYTDIAPIKIVDPEPSTHTKPRNTDLPGRAAPANPSPARP
jgi:hypothetical protein